jgi:hypothetical protein
MLAPSILAAMLLPALAAGDLDKIAQLSAAQHAALLFTTSPRGIICVRQGQVAWIDNANRRLIGPALSHDGSRIAFIADGAIGIHEIATGTEHRLASVSDDPGELAWSWDDSEIAFVDHGIFVVRADNGTGKVLFTNTPLSPVGPIAWLHNKLELVAELSDAPGHSGIFVVGHRSMRRIDSGRRPAVSPLSDRIAYYASEGLVAIDAEGTARSVLYRARKSPSAPIVWSPEGGRLFFGEVVGNDDRENLYLLTLRSHKAEKFLAHTSIRIRGWQ